MSNTTTDDYEETSKPTLSSEKCPKCDNNLYWVTNHIIIYGDFERAAKCFECDKEFVIQSRNSLFSR